MCSFSLLFLDWYGSWSWPIKAEEPPRQVTLQCSRTTAVEICRYCVCVCASANSLILRNIPEVIGSFRQQKETGRLPGNAQEKCWQLQDHSSEKFVCDEMPSSCFSFRGGAGGSACQREGCQRSSLLAEVGGAPPSPPAKKSPYGEGLLGSFQKLCAPPSSPHFVFPFKAPIGLLSFGNTKTLGVCGSEPPQLPHKRILAET